MPKTLKDAKLCLLTCPFEPPKPKTKHKLDITSKEAYDKLFQREQKYFADMVKKCKDVGTTLVRKAKEMTIERASEGSSHGCKIPRQDPTNARARVASSRQIRAWLWPVAVSIGVEPSG